MSVSGNSQIMHRKLVLRRVAAMLFAASALFATACKSALQTAPAGAPEVLPIEAARFAIVATTDSTVSFRAGEVEWLRVGMSGYAVDPAARDAFVARLVLITEQQGGFTALVTGQVRPVDSTYVVIVERPAVPAWRKRDFWWGAAWGSVAGALIALAAKIGS